MPDQNPDDVERVETLEAICDVLGIGIFARDRQTILMNIHNLLRRSACLSVVEDTFQETCGEGDDEMTKSKLSWGASPKEFEEQFRGEIAAMQGWRPIESAIKSRKPILALFKDDAFPKDGRFSSFNGKQAPIFHAGITPSGYDCGWGIALPVGFGGFTDYQFVGWQPLPQPPESSDD